MTDLPQPDSAGAQLRRHVRTLGGALVLPLLGLLALLTWMQYGQQEELATRALERQMLIQRAELQPVAGATHAHVADLKNAMTDWLAQPPDHGPGLAQLLAPVGPASAPDGYTLDAAPDAVREQLGQVQVYRADGRRASAAVLNATESFLSQARLVHLRAPPFSQTWLVLFADPLWATYPYVPTRERLAAAPAGSLREMRASTQKFHQRLVEWVDLNGAAAFSWLPPFKEATGPRLNVGHSAPVVVDGVVQGIVGVGIELSTLQSAIEQAAAKTGGRWWLVDPRMDAVIADSAQAVQMSAPLGAGDTLIVPLAQQLPARVGMEAVRQARAQPGHAVKAAGQVIVSVALEPAPWVLMTMLPQQQLAAQIWLQLLPFAALGVALLLLMLGAQWLMRREFVTPAIGVMGYLRALSQEDQSVPPRLARRWQPWVDAVTQLVASRREMLRREHRSEAFKLAVVDNALAAIVITDAAGVVVDWNPAAAGMLGWSREQALGRAVGELLVPERMRAAHLAGMQRMQQGGQPHMIGRRVEMPACQASGSEIPVEMVISRILVDGDVYYCAMLADLSNRQRAAQEIERQRDALRQSEKLSAMGSLLAGVAHELNNPLAIVMGRASMLEEKLRDPANRLDAQRIREAADRCGRIVRTFLNMARSRPPQRGPVAINDLARAAADMLGYTLRSHGIKFELMLSEGLPALQADGDQLGQVVLNLLVNAQQALAQVPEGQRRISLSTGMAAANTTTAASAGRQALVWLRVADTGPGVAPAAREQLFQAFFTTKSEGMGTGLGLSVSRSLVREHGGELLLEDGTGRQGEGASFLMRLPIGSAADAAQALPDTRLADPHAATCRVLVVDDEPEIADLARDTLEAAGFEVATAESGAVALEMLAEVRFDAIVSDLHMPEVDGPALWRAVRERHPALASRMLFVTGDSLSPSAAEFLRQAGCAALEKPFKPGELLARVKAIAIQPM